jgi:hypothetical protein
MWAGAGSQSVTLRAEGVVAPTSTPPGLGPGQWASNKTDQ